MKNVTIYTDGACSGNPGRGGWGAVLQYGPHERRISGYEQETTNNRMEIMGAISALELLREPCEVSIHSDSSYLVNAFLKHWIDGWQRNGWKTADKKPVENQDLWLRLLDAVKPHKVLWIKVKGHSDNALNNVCDEMARKEIQSRSNG